MKEALELLKKIEQYGYEAYLVGGAPRDIYLNRCCEDFDICTNAKPTELLKIFRDANMTNAKYGNVRVIFKEVEYEITTFRKELSYENHRKPKEMIYVNSLVEDLERRDFIINTLCMNSKGEYVDYLNAREDIQKKILRSVGDANQKLEEDALRILRAIRFASTLNFQMEESLKLAIQKNKVYLKEISYERKKEELEKIFVTEKGIEYLLEFGLEEVLEIPKLKEVKEHDLASIWKTLDVFDKYPFSKKEKEKYQ